MNRKAYLTVDDGPSLCFRSFVDFCLDHEIPAVFFNRGDYMEERALDVLYAIKKGFIIANHAYSHTRFSELSLEQGFQEILKTQTIIDGLYERADVLKPPRYFRFPYMDRGMGPWLVEPEEFFSLQDIKRPLRSLVQKGLGHSVSDFETYESFKASKQKDNDSDISPIVSELHKKRELQSFLKRNNFEVFAKHEETPSWFQNSEMKNSYDVLCTLSTCDWALNQRHIGKHGISSQSDIEKYMEEEIELQKEGVHIILVHDQDEIHQQTLFLIEMLLEKDWVFI